MRQTSSRSVGPGWPSEPPGPPASSTGAKIHVLPTAQRSGGHRTPVARLLSRLTAHLRDLATVEAEPGTGRTARTGTGRTALTATNIVPFPAVGRYRHPSRWSGPGGGTA